MLVLEKQVKVLTESLGRRPKLVTVSDMNNLGSVGYTKVKKRLAERIGVDFEVKERPDMANWNADSTVDGIMIQLPYPNSDELIHQIDVNKDVDGLRDDSKYLPATVKAVLEIMKEAGVKNGKEVVVIGNRGEVGRRLQRILECQGMDKEDFDVEVVKRAHVIVSATGVAGLISVDMVDEGVVVIDVGYPEGDVAQVVATKARFFTPVPGGVGPMTVVMLFENLVEAAILNNHGGTTKS